MAGFIPHVYGDGKVDGWAHLGAAVGTYHVGMALNLTSGNLAKASGATKPTHICMCEKTVSTAGEVIAAVPVDPTTEFAVVLTAAVSGLTAGSAAGISSDGMSLAANADGAIRVVSTSGAAIGDTAIIKIA
ncbi:MAG: hypothetical protein IKZ09_00560 [Clostridia bacterium]|nr:hypothetical protein [Clostridia bacterium]